ncbi:TonB-dependent receptor [Azospirillum cavernae]|uniref:TonB-dependent receptor n=1 Tax=Azospirillum cavernae TaxID=2320860 RepID=A0A418VQ90_9PROT|nr:TonB-dependent receptor [Azospirillum cavernae]RJF78427.1 TonB-dependent receptor [Azospirillum cavernae]
MTRIQTGGALALASLVALQTLPAAAQTTNAQTTKTQATNAQAASGGSVTLDTLTVTGQGKGSLTVPSAEQAREDLGKTVGSVGFVDSESYKGTLSNTLRDVLGNVPGVFVENRYGQELRLSVRGSGMARGYHLRGVELLQDGVPVNAADGSGDFYQIDPLSLRYAEVFKGGNGLAYGSSTLGGAINMVTPTAHTAVAPNLLRVDGGSFGTLRTTAQASRVLGDLDFLINGTLSHSDGHRDHARQQYEQVNGNIGYRVSPDVETRFYFGEYVTHQKLPGSLSLSEALNRPTMATAAVLSGDQARDVWTQRIANRTSVKLESGQLDVASWAIRKKLFHPIFQVIDQTGWTYGLAPRYTTSFTVGGLRDELVVGARLTAGNTKARQFVNLNGSRGAQTVDSRQNAYNAELFAENRLYVLPTLAVMTGAKALRDLRTYSDLLSPSKNGDRAYYGFNPKIGLLWEPKPTIQAFVNLSRSQDVPDFSDLNQTQANGTLGFVPLQPQRAWTAEIGTRGEIGRVSWDVTAYRSVIRGEMLQFVTNSNVPAATFNADRTIHQGLEIGGKAVLAADLAQKGDSLTFGQMWTYNDFTFDGDRQYGNNTLAGMPRHVLRSTLTYSNDGFYLTPTVDWVPQGAWADQANTLKVPGHTLLGLQVGKEFSNGLLIFIDGRNLTNKRYISDIGTVTDARRVATSIFYPGEGRAVYAGVRAAF